MEQVDTLWEEVKRFENPHGYYVDLSQKLWDIKLLSQIMELFDVSYQELTVVCTVESDNG